MRLEKYSYWERESPNVSGKIFLLLNASITFAKNKSKKGKCDEDFS